MYFIIISMNTEPSPSKKHEWVSEGLSHEVLFSKTLTRLQEVLSKNGYMFDVSKWNQSVHVEFGCGDSGWQAIYVNRVVTRSLDQFDQDLVEYFLATCFSRYFSPWARLMPRITDEEIKRRRNPTQNISSWWSAGKNTYEGEKGMRNVTPSAQPAQPTQSQIMWQKAWNKLQKAA